MPHNARLIVAGQCPRCTRPQLRIEREATKLLSRWRPIRPIRLQCLSYFKHSHRYTLSIPVVGIVREPFIYTERYYFTAFANIVLLNKASRIRRDDLIRLA